MPPETAPDGGAPATGRSGLADSAFLLIAGLAFFLPAIASRDVWQSLETRYATIAREMAETGDWLIPKVNGEPYQDKPPLFFWLAAALRTLGIGAQGVRVVSALAAAGTLLVVAALARLWFPRRTALLAAAVLATTPEFGWLGRFGELDVALTLFTTLAAYGWFRGGRAVALFYLGIGLAVMVKGPSGVLVPLLAVAAGRLARVGPSSPRAPLHPIWGSALAVLPAACWFVPAIVKAGPSYVHELIGHHMLGRVVNSWQHRQPFYFYLNEGPANFLPWLPLAIPAGVRAWRRRRDEPASAMALAWLLLGLAAFSAVSGKRIAYILPLAPAFALLVARGADALLVSAERPERRTAAILFWLHVVLAGVGAALLGFGLLGTHVSRLFEGRAGEALRPIARLPGGATVAAGGLLLLGIAAAGARLARTRRYLASLVAMVASMAVGFLVVDFTFVPRVDTLRSPRTVAGRMDALVPPGAGEVGIYPACPPGSRGEGEYAYGGAFNIYSSRLYLTPLRSPEDVRRFLASPERRLVLGGSMSIDGLGELPPGAYRSVAGVTGRATIIFVTNFPVESPSVGSED